MIFFTLYILVLLLSKVKSDQLSDYTWRDMDNNTIKVNEYCANKNCIIKCCPTGTVVAGRKCIKPLLPNIIKMMNYSTINIYNWNVSSDKPIFTTKKLKEHFVFIQNDFFMDFNKTLPLPGENYVLEDGSIKSVGYKAHFPKLQYCADFSFRRAPNKTKYLQFLSRSPRLDETEAKIKQYCVAAAMFMSAVFMLLVLLVYGVLPQLQNIVGMSLMAYLATLICGYVMKAAQLIVHCSGNMDDIKCRITSPPIYYFIVASFFWLNIMSFDLWWTIRDILKCRGIHRHGELVKFGWYCLYAWGSSLLLTGTIVIVDRYDLANEAWKPPFDSCFRKNSAYLHVPIGIITVGNIIMFILTTYNIWLIKRGVRNTNDNKTKNSENRFVVYINIFVLMGVTWILELLPDMPLIPYIIVNSLNMFIGVTIFVMFVCKKSVIVMLCKRDEKNCIHAVGNELPMDKDSSRPRFVKSLGDAYVQRWTSFD